MTDSQQRRHFTRIQFDTEYQLTSAENNQQCSGELVDISLHGALIKRPDNVDIATNDKCNLELKLGDDGIKIQMETHVAHVHDDLVGLECDHIDLESMTHLRRVLELNLGDSKLMEREIPEMIEVFHK